MNKLNNVYRDSLKHVLTKIDLKKLEDKTVLLVGSTGLIGSFIVDLVYIHNLSSENKIFLIAVNREEIRVKERFSYINDDAIRFLFSRVENLRFDFFDKKIDFIIHAGSNADPITFAKYPVETITSNVRGTLALLDIARHFDSRMLFVSSREVYGYIEDSIDYKEEEYGLCDFNLLRSSYPESKRISELLCRSYRDEYGVNVVIARLGYIYGETQTSQDSRVIAQFLRNAVLKQNIELKSLGLQKRTYTHVSDCVTGMLLILQEGNDIVYNVSNEKAVVTIAGLAEIIARIAGTKVVKGDLSFVEKKGSSDNHDALLNCDKLKALGWCSEYGIEEGIRHTLDVLIES